MIRRFFSYYKPYQGLFWLSFICSIIVGVLELSFPLIVNQFIDHLLPQGNWKLIFWACLGLLVVYLINSFLQYVFVYWGHKLGINIETDMRQKLFDHVQKLSFRYFDNQKTGQLISRLTNDLFEIGELAHHGPEDIFIAIMTLLGTFIIMLYIHVKLALLTFLIMPILLALGIYFNQRMTRTSRKLYEQMGSFHNQIESTIGGIRVVKAFGNEEHETKEFHTINRRFRKIKLQSYQIIGYNLSVSYLLMRLSILFILVSGTWFVIQKDISYGGFVGFVLLTNVLFRPIEKINAVIESYPKGIAGFKRYTELLDTEPDIADKPDAIPVEHLQGNIRYEHVSFSYSDSAPVLHDFNLTIQPGETIAFVGPSGTGKTTICSLLPRFYEVTQGRITIDRIDIRDMKQTSLRQQIGIVQQDVYLFAGTIRENISYGRLHASDEEIWTAAKHAQLTDLIHSLPDGIDTIVGERGVKLSGGQKQRIAIARVFLKNPPILILDEATSALDTATEVAIQEALNKLAQGRTTLVIAHRLATIQKADRIIVVDHNGIIEQGAHEELLAKKGMYHQLYHAQFQMN
ncbi:ATP-binding cassette, subfamily B [Seinonella peptonophila]|uniref:ATP-binding cassette, subfamily B n=1 Tax=Seinonella peptonophila TaxID=112248 RepID=A0A1M5A6L5_9BACL|nr:ABC transporter ATP-binding protein [Seinonella peptonophila]SHF25969.1 ATP-binding cassette, subfamily B [Seinonella peptonophila]